MPPDGGTTNTESALGRIEQHLARLVQLAEACLAGMAAALSRADAGHGNEQESDPEHPCCATCGSAMQPCLCEVP